MKLRLFVANFDTSIEWEDLDKLFSGYGTVTRVKIWRDLRTGESRRFGFVDMGHEEEARRAIDSLDGKWWQGRRLKVSFARETPF